MHQMDETDYYTVLGVAPSSPPDEVTRAYRRLARLNHPDLHPGDAESDARFKQINQAYHVLSDPEKRVQYDQQLAGSRSSPSPEDAQNAHDAWPAAEQQTSAIQREDIAAVEETIGELATAFQEIASQAAEEMRAALRDFGVELDAMSRKFANTVESTDATVNRASQRGFRPPPPQVRNSPPQNGQPPWNGRSPRDGRPPRP